MLTEIQKSKIVMAYLDFLNRLRESGCVLKVHGRVEILDDGHFIIAEITDGFYWRPMINELMSDGKTRKIFWRLFLFDKTSSRVVVDFSKNWVRLYGRVFIYLGTIPKRTGFTGDGKTDQICNNCKTVFKQGSYTDEN